MGKKKSKKGTAGGTRVGSSDISSQVVVEPPEEKVTEVKESVVDQIYSALLNAAESMGLTKKVYPTRIQFSNGTRVVALEKGKKRVTMHLPKKLLDKEISASMKKSFDKRGFGYVRVNSLTDVPEAISLIEWAKENNSK